MGTEWGTPSILEEYSGYILHMYTDLGRHIPIVFLLTIFLGFSVWGPHSIPVTRCSLAARIPSPCHAQAGCDGYSVSYSEVHIPAASPLLSKPLPVGPISIPRVL